MIFNGKEYHVKVLGREIVFNTKAELDAFLEATKECSVEELEKQAKLDERKIGTAIVHDDPFSIGDKL